MLFAQSNGPIRLPVKPLVRTLSAALSVLLLLSLGVATSGCDSGGGGSEATLPSVPQGLTAASTGSAVELSWNAGGSSAGTAFNVYRAEGTSASTSGTPVNGATPVSATTFEDTGVSEGDVYTYAVTAVNDAGESRASAGVTIRFFPDPPSRP